MKNVPSYYFKNIAKHKQKQFFGKIPEFKDARYEASRQVSDLFIEILKENGVSEEDCQRVIVESNEYAKKFKDRLSYSEKDVEKESGKRTSGTLYAYHKLKEDSKELMPYGFTYPLKESPKRQKDFVKAGQQREGAEVTLRMYAIGANIILGYTEEDIKKILVRIHEKL